MATLVEPSGRTIQRMTALEHANAVRISASALKREMRVGVLRLEDALQDPRALPIEVGDLLLAQPRWGRTKSRHALKRLGISEHRRVRDLTARELGVVTGLGR